jgi:integrative and conjugative element protein (TIGR02256 family)
MRLTIGTAWIGESVVEALRTEADRTFPLETGGVLLGYWVRPGEEVVIVEAVGPGPGAVHGERRFRPDRDFQEAQIARHYHESGRYHTYLGDWHTHPRGAPRLSRLDRRTLRAITRDPDARAPMPLMAILADGTPWSLVLWCCVPARSLTVAMPSRIVSLQLRTFAAMV